MISKRSKPVRLTEVELLVGDHVFVRRRGRFYAHHGIYLGDGRVIHFSGSVAEKRDPRVVETDLSRFVKDGILRRRHHKERLSAADTIRIATSQLTDENYSMVWNNCEHFVTYCVTGKKKSRQVRKVLSGLSAVAAGIAFYVVTRAVKSTAGKP